MRAIYRYTGAFSAFVLALGLMEACGSQDTAAPNDDYQDAVPELGAVELQLTGDIEAEGLAAEQDALDAEAMVADEVDVALGLGSDEVASDLAQARMAVRNLNQALRAFLEPVVATVRNAEPSRVRGDARVWGPVMRGMTEYRFVMRRNAHNDFGWLLQARVAEEDTAFVAVAAGQLRVGAQKRRGTGKAVFDLDALGGVDPLVAARGTVLVGFTHGEDGTTVGYGLRNFTRDPESSEPIDALVQQVRLSGPRYRLRLAYRGDVAGTSSNSEELVLARHRHVGGSGGRSDAIIVEGDVPDGDAWVISQCWSAELKEGYRVVRSCPLDGIGGEACSVVSTVGDVGSCAAALHDAELPPSEPSQPMVDEEDPNGAVEIPESISELDAPEE